MSHSKEISATHPPHFQYVTPIPIAAKLAVPILAWFSLLGAARLCKGLRGSSSKELRPVLTYTVDTLVSVAGQTLPPTNMTDLAGHRPLWICSCHVCSCLLVQQVRITTRPKQMGNKSWRDALANWKQVLLGFPRHMGSKSRGL